MVKIMDIRRCKQYQKELVAICNENLPFEKLQNSKILVTGATGLIGSYLVDLLLELNQQKKLDIQVFALCRNLEISKSLFEVYLQREDFTIMEGDVMEPLHTNCSFTYIIHAAGNNHPLAFSTQPVETIKASVIGTMNLLEHCISQKEPVERFLFLSTGEVYGEQMQLLEHGCDENQPGMVNSMNPRSCYPEGKRAAESLCVAYGTQYKIPTTVARLSYIFGPTMQKTSSKADIQFLQKAIHKEDILLKSSGTQYRSYMYLADAAIAIVYILLKGQDNQAYNVADKHGNITIRNFAEMVAKQAGVHVQFENPSDIEQAGYSKMNREILIPDKLYELGYSGRVSLEEGIQRILEMLS